MPLANEKSVYADDDDFETLARQSPAEEEESRRSKLRSHAESIATIIEEVVKQPRKLEEVQTETAVTPNGCMMQCSARRLRSLAFNLFGVIFTTGCLVGCVVLKETEDARKRECDDPDRPPDEECDPYPYPRPLGTSFWRWLLLLGLLYPMHWVSGAFVTLATAVLTDVYILSANVVYFAVQIRKPVTQMITYAGWMVIWLILMAPRRDEMGSAYDIIWRIFLCLVILRLLQLTKKGGMSWLALSFHQRAHFQKMQDALFKEFLLLSLTRPNPVQRTSVIQGLPGYTRAHYSALQYVTSLLSVVRGSALANSEMLHPSISLQAPMSKESGFLTPEGLTRNGTSVFANPTASLSPSYLQDLDFSFQSPVGGRPPVSKHVAIIARLEKLQLSLINLIADSAMEEALRDGERVRRRDVIQKIRQALRDDTAGTDRYPISVRRAARKWLQVTHHHMLTHKLRAMEGGATRMTMQQAVQAMLKREQQQGNRGITKIDTKAAQKVAEEDESWRSSLPSGRDVAAAASSALVTLGGLERYLRGSHLKVHYSSAYSSRARLKQMAAIDDDDGTEEIRNKSSARRVGFYIFWNLKRNSERMDIIESDLRALIPDPGQRALAWKMLDPDGSGTADLQECVDCVVSAYRSRKQLARTLLDTQGVIHRVDTTATVLMWIVLIFVFFAIFDVDSFRLTWTALSAGLISFSFIFGNSMCQVWENMVYLFTVHPFDVGDQIKMDGDMYKVEKIALGYVTVLRTDNARLTFPMQVVRTKPLHNITRSELMWDSFKVLVDIDTPKAHLESVGDAIVEHLRANRSLYGGNYRVFFTQASLQHKLELAVFFDYGNTGGDLMACGIARTLLYDCIQAAMRETGIMYTFPPTRDLYGCAQTAASDPTQQGAREEFARDQMGQGTFQDATSDGLASELVNRRGGQAAAATLLLG